LFWKCLIYSMLPSTFPKWFFKNLKRIVLNKKRTHAKIKTTHCPLDYAELASVCFPLWLHFRRSIDSGAFLSAFKISSVTLIFKSSAKADVNNYRQVSILSHISKLFKLLVLRNIQLPINSILIDVQYGFRPSRSATTNWMVFNNIVEKHI